MLKDHEPAPQTHGPEAAAEQASTASPEPAHSPADKIT